MKTDQEIHACFEVMATRQRVLLRLIVKKYHKEHYGIFTETPDGKSRGFKPYPRMSPSIVIAAASRMAQILAVEKGARGYRRDGGDIRVPTVQRAPVTEKLLSGVLTRARHGSYHDIEAVRSMAVDNKQFRVLQKLDRVLSNAAC